MYGDCNTVTTPFQHSFKPIFHFNCAIFKPKYLSTKVNWLPPWNSVELFNTVIELWIFWSCVKVDSFIICCLWMMLFSTIDLFKGLGHYKITARPQQVKGDIEGEKIVSLGGKGDCVLAVSGKLFSVHKS